MYVASASPHLAPKHGGQKRKVTTSVEEILEDNDESDDETAVVNKVQLDNTADPAKERVSNAHFEMEILAETDSLLSDLAVELTEQEATEPAINADLAGLLDKHWSEKLSDKKLTDKLDLI